MPERLKIRSPTLANWLIMMEMLKGIYIADLPIIVDAIDPCLSCSQRITITDYSSGNRNTTTLDQLRKRNRRGAGNA
jgi:Ni,Fe-hydrogenase III large subunit